CKGVVVNAPLNSILPAILAATALSALAATPPDARRDRIAANLPWLNTTVPSAPGASATGVFGPVIQWPSVPIHVVLTPDGRVVALGPTATGKAGGELDYPVGHPALGPGEDAFRLRPTTTEVNAFCAGQWLLPASGKVMITGGTLVAGGIRGIGISDVTIFN